MLMWLGDWLKLNRPENRVLPKTRSDGGVTVWVVAGILSSSHLIRGYLDSLGRWVVSSELG